MKQVSAGIFDAGKAELMLADGTIFTVLYGTGEALVRLVAAVFPATGAGTAISNE